MKRLTATITLTMTWFLCSWTIAHAQNEFITTWKTDNTGTSEDNEITIPTLGSATYDYDVDWGDGNSDANVTGDITHTYASAGTYTVSITGTFPHIYFNGGGDKEKILAVTQWGNIAWTGMYQSFKGCINLDVTATDAPDLSAVTSMQEMFSGATSFNTDIDHWDVSNVTSMHNLFAGATSFNQDLNSWDVSSVTSLSGTFSNATAFNGNITSWNVSNVTTMLGLFYKNHNFNQPIGNWDVSSVTNMTSIFREARAFNQDISNWDVSSVTTFRLMFDDASDFNQNISGWNTSSATDMSFMFRKASLFNQLIGTWDVSAVTNMEEMFHDASAFNQDLNSWNVSSVTNMGLMFRFTDVFNGNITNWDVSSVTNMSFMFNGASVFNQDISTWNVSAVTSMNGMFYSAASFDQPIGSWNVSSVTNMFNMLRDASAFDQDISGWDVSNVADMTNFLNTSGISKSNYDQLLGSWSQLTLQNNVTFGASGIEYCYGSAARQSIIDNFSWTINDAGENCRAFITTWKTDNIGTSEDNEVNIPTEGTGYDYTVDWGDGSSDMNVTGDITHTYASAGTYSISITGDFPRIFFNGEGDMDKILSIEQWGDIQWVSMARAFQGCSNLTYNATDIPDLSNVTSLQLIFSYTDLFNADLSDWDVGTITNMNSAFFDAASFNGDVTTWDVSNVTNMAGMFENADVFNQNLNDWDVSSVISMISMFRSAFAFDQPLGNWDVSNVTNMTFMFYNASSFNQDIGSWDISNVISMRQMFNNALAFNQDISSWNTAEVLSMWSAFNNAESFNQDISNWNTGKVEDMRAVFFDAESFNQNLSGWDISSATEMDHMFSGSDLSKLNYDAILEGWSQQTVQNDVTFGAGLTKYCYGADGKSVLESTYNWTISDGGQECLPFITTWKTDNTGTSNNDQITIPTTGTGYDYTVDWGDGNSDTGVTGDITHTYASAGTYTVTISGDFPRVYFNDAGDEEKLLTIEQWGDIQWASMQNAFAGCRNMRVPATDAPNLSAATDMSNMFKDCIAFNDPIDHWDVSNVELMSGTFRSAIAFNRDLNSWDVGNVTNFSSMFLFGGAFNGDISDWDVSSGTDFSSMFNRAHVFNQDIGGWDVGNASNFGGMFFQAFAFDQDIGSWDTSSVTNVSNMFRQATSFNQPIGSWDISSVTNISGMFWTAEAFNQDISSWDLSGVIDLSNMFRGALAFNQDLNGWNTSGLNSLSGLFFGATAFNGKVDNWDVSNVTNFTSVFKDASSFDQDVSGWNVSSATTMVEMYSAASAFDQNIGSWDVSNVTDMTNMLALAGLSKSNYDKLLNGWSVLTLQSDVPFRTSSQYCYGADARQSILDNFNWVFTDSGENCQSFITTWKTDNTGASNDDQITIPTTGTGYDYTVDWGDGNSDMGVTGDITHTYASAGTYTVIISGDFPRIYFNNGGDKDKILTIEQWGDIEWKSMRLAFFGCANLTYNATDSPNLSEVTDMFAMFFQATSFNGDIGNWDVSNITNMQSLFGGATSFNQDIGGWDVSNVTNLTSTFFDTPFNQDIGSWDVGNVTTMRSLFHNATSFNQDIGSWDVSNVTDMKTLFVGATAFNTDISEWDVSSVTNMNGTFQGASAFNQDLNTWNVSNVIDFEQMFNLATSFNQDLNTWDVGSATTMKSMFENASVFNGNISDWNVSNVVLTNRMFLGAANFNHDLSSWDVSSVTNMSDMFNRARAFNGDIENWDVSSVTNMVGLFFQADDFNQNLANWNVSSVTNMTVMFDESGLTKSSYDRTLTGWSRLTLQDNVTFGATGIEYCFGAGARQSIIDNFNWTMTDGGENCQAFVTTWKTDNTGGSDDDQITIPTTGTGYNYSVDWGDGNNDTNVTGNITHTYASAGTYTVSITGDFPRIYFEGADDPQKILTVEQWGDIQWTSMEKAFSNCSNLDITATDAPDLSEVTNMVSMFVGASAMNGAIGHWDISNVTDISGMFFSAVSFNQPINDWDVSNVTKMNAVFSQASMFNQDLNNWDVSNVTEMSSTFNRAFDFNGDISNWDVSNVNRMRFMFQSASSFKQPIGEWDVSNVTDMYSMFVDADAFNSDIGSWDVSSLTDASIMFTNNDAFNQNIGNWDVSNVTTMDRMFLRATAFNQDLSNWDVSSVTNMENVFKDATSFNQDLSAWNVSTATSMTHMLSGTALSINNYDKTLEGWSLLTLQSNVNFGASGIEYCTASVARQSIVDNFGWTITDGGENCIVNIPDANFKAALLENTSINTTDDGEISVQEALAYSGSLNVSDLAIASLVGIEAFVNLTSLTANGNDLTTLDLSANTKLTSFQGFNNELTSIDVTGLSELISLNVTNSSLTNIDVSTLAKLDQLTLVGNELTSLDVSNNTMMRVLNAQTNNLISLDVSNNTKLDWLYIQNNQISLIDLTSNIALDILFAGGNNLSSIDLSQNITLKDLRLMNNNLSVVDLSSNDALESVFLNDNQLTSVDLRSDNNENISTIDLRNNSGLTCVVVDNVGYSRLNWTNIDDPAVFKITCDPNDIVNIPDANLKAALLANTAINTSDDGEITYGEAEAFTGRISVQSLTIADLTGLEAFTNLTELEAFNNDINTVELSNNSSLTFINLSSNNLTDLDVTGLPGLEVLSSFNNQLLEINTSENPALIQLSVHRNDLTSVDLSANQDLERLNVSDNNITSVDVSIVPNLTELEVHLNSGMTALDVSNLTNLRILRANGTSISDLDLTANSSLVELLVHNNNNLNSLDLRNDNNEAIQDSRIRINEVPNLSCVAVSNRVHASNNWVTFVDSGIEFKLSCDPNEVLNIPDSNFKAELLANTSINSIDDGEITYGEAEAYTGSLILAGKEISDLSGIQYFQNVTVMNATGNTLSDVNLSQNIGLELLILNSNNFSAIDLSQNINLTSLSLGFNDLTSLDISENTNLEILEVYQNNLTDLDVSKNTLLTRLSAHSNELTTIDVSGLGVLEDLELGSQPLASLNVSSNPELLYLGMNDTPISDINLNSNTKLLELKAQRTSLTSIDLSANTDLELLFLLNNGMTSLDVANNVNLVDLRVQDNNLSSLDLSTLSNLEIVEVHNNDLTELALNNGNNTAITTFNAIGNNDLTCITVDDVVYSQTNWTEIESTSNFSTNCSNVSNDILTFTLSEQVGEAIIDVIEHTIQIEVILGTDITNLSPTILISSGASINPLSGSAQDFSNAFTYTVTAENPTALQDWLVTVQEENAVPTDISLDNNSIAENSMTNTLVGTFSTTDANATSSHVYDFASGVGDEDNNSFDLIDDKLILVDVPDFEIKNNYSIRVQTDDGRGGVFDKVFAISIIDVAESPIGLSISSNDIDENSAIGTVVGTFSTEDQDAGDSFTYDLVSGSGDTNNASFKIEGAVLQSEEVFDFEIKNSYSIRVKTTDSDGGTFEQQFSIDVNDEFEKTNQTITFDAIPDKVFGDMAFELSAVATSELSVSFSVISGNVTISDNTVTITGAGAVTIAGDQAGDDNFNAAPQVTQSFNIAKADQTITIEAISDKLSNEDPFDVVAMTDSGLDLTYEVNGPATILGTTITLTGGLGEVTVTVSQNGNDNYNSVTESITFMVDMPTGIADEPLIDHVYPNPADNWLVVKKTVASELEYGLYSASGSLVGHGHISTNFFKIDVSTLREGLYVLKIKSQQRVTTTKILIER